MSFEFHPGATKALNDGGRDLLSKIEILKPHKAANQSFKSERPVGATISKSELVEDPFVWVRNEDGGSLIVFIFEGSDTYGISEDNFKEIRRLSDIVLKTKWARNTLSLKFLEMTILRWCRSSYKQDNIQELADAVLVASEKSIQSRTMWAPIANLEIQSEFEFGITQIKPITQNMIDDLKSQAVQDNSGQADKVSELFENMRKEMQGLAAVVFEIVAEPDYTYEKALKIANDVAGLLRFFSDASYNPWLTSSNSPLGSEYTPKSNIILFGPDDSFSWKTGLISNSVLRWSISDDDLKEHINNGLNNAGFLIEEENLNAFQLKFRSSILTYSKGMTLTDVNDRLVYTLSALESLFLRNASEPIQQNLGERMAFLIADDGKSRKAVVKTVKGIYNTRSQYVHHRVSASEEEELSSFNILARMALNSILLNINYFKTVEEFHDFIDERKFGADG